MGGNCHGGVKEVPGGRRSLGYGVEGVIFGRNERGKEAE